MKKQHIAIFAGWQLAGFLTGLGAHHVDTLSWMISAVMLVPGTAASVYLFRLGGIGNQWAKWTLFAIPVAINSVLFLLLYWWRRQHRQVGFQDRVR